MVKKKGPKLTLKLKNKPVSEGKQPLAPPYQSTERKTPKSAAVDSPVNDGEDILASENSPALAASPESAMPAQATKAKRGRKPKGSLGVGGVNDNLATEKPTNSKEGRRKRARKSFGDGTTLKGKELETRLVDELGPIEQLNEDEGDKMYTSHHYLKRMCTLFSS